MAWQIRDLIEKEYKEKIVDMASLKVLTTDFCARFPIAQAILSDLDSED